MLKAGDVLRGDYVIERLIGRGGMGCVYRAHQRSLGDRPVAVKELVLEGDGDEMRDAAFAQFRREAQTLGSIEHTNLVDVKDFFRDGEAEYLVMGFIDGVTLEDVVRDNPRFVPIGLALAWADAICDVLGCLHGQSPPVIVRDLKPANVMIDVSGRLRLIDFGIARTAPTGSQTSTFVKGVGTVGFSPLEQYGLGGTDARSDIYSLGATLYAVLTRTTPAWSIGRNTGEEQLIPPSRLNPAVPAPLEAVLDRMLALRAADRYADVGQARQALRQAAAFVAAAPPPLPRRFCSSCGEPVVAVAGRCHHCRVVFEDVETIFPVEAAATTAPLTLPPVPIPLAPPPPVSTPPTSLALAPPAPVRRGPSPVVAVLAALLAGALVYGAVRGTTTSPSRRAASPTATMTAVALAPSASAPPEAAPSPSIEASPSPSPVASPRPEPPLDVPLAVPSTPPAAPTYLMPDSARRAITPADLAGKDARHLCLIRNEIFARHGRIFETPEIRAWFEAQPWYHPRADYRDAMLTPLERHNARVVLQYEDAHGARWP